MFDLWENSKTKGIAAGQELSSKKEECVYTVDWKRISGCAIRAMKGCKRCSKRFNEEGDKPETEVI